VAGRGKGCSAAGAGAAVLAAAGSTNAAAARRGRGRSNCGWPPCGAAPQQIDMVTQNRFCNPSTVGGRR
jgi:hypothetical protein